MTCLKSLSIAKMQIKSVSVFQDVLSLFNIYSYHIRPFISDACKLERSSAWDRSTLFIRENEKHFLVNNFELFHIIKNPDVGFNVLRQEVEVQYISKDQFEFELCFYELIETITQHNKKLDIKLIYKQLKSSLDKQRNQQLFDKNIFAVTKFCELLHITEQTYHKRRSGVLS